MSYLSVAHLEKSFGSTRVLRDVSFDLPEGETLSVIGSSGSGKTTLLRCLNFLETPEAGCIRVNGETLLDAADPATMGQKAIREKRLHFGLVFQQFNLFPQYTVQENVTLAKKLLTRERLKKSGSFEGRTDLRQIFSAIDREAEALLSQVGMSAKVGSYPSQVSGGQQQRAAIARALALKPDILCFDEPTSALDPELTGEVLKVIRQLARQRTTMVIVTHEMVFARDVADQVIFMDGGVIVEQGEPRMVMDHPKEERTRQFLARYAQG